VTWARIGTIAGALAALYFVFSFYAQAQSDSAEQVTLVEAVEALAAIHVRQDTVDAAEARLKAEWCLAGKLVDPGDCAIVLLPAVSAAPPAEPDP